MNIKNIIDAYYKKTYIDFDGCLVFCINVLENNFLFIDSFFFSFVHV